MDDNYLLQSGQNLYAGWNTTPQGGFAPGAAVGSVSGDFVWTPGFAEDGRVTQASINALPVNTWVAVNGSHLADLRQKIIDTGFDWDTDNWGAKDFSRLFKAWVGACDDGWSVYVPRGGGHGDSSQNGIYAFDLQTMRWRVEKAPSRPYTPGLEWHINYKIAGSFTPYRDESNVAIDPIDGIYFDRLPDNTPTSAHTYNGCWFDTRRRLIGTGRVSKWTYPLDTKVWSRARWTIGGAATTFTIRQQIHYYEPKDMLFGFFARSDSDYSGFGKCPADSTAYTNTGGPTNFQTHRSLSSCRYGEHRLIFFWRHDTSGTQRSAIFNMQTENWEYQGVIDGGFNTGTGNSEMMGCTLIPTWGAQGQVIRLGVAGDVTGVYFLHDIATHQDLAYTVQGRLPEPSRPGSKARLMPEAGLAFWLDGEGSISNPAVHVMRYA